MNRQLPIGQHVPRVEVSGHFRVKVSAPEPLECRVGVGVGDVFQLNVGRPAHHNQTVLLLHEVWALFENIWIVLA